MIARLSRFTIAVAIGTVIAAACSPTPPLKPLGPMRTPGFDSAVAIAAKRVDALDYAGADRILSDFALASRGSVGAKEITFWRALYLVDPMNKTGSAVEGLKAIDIYLSTPGAAWYRSQAQVVRRTAVALQALRTAQQGVKSVARDTVIVNHEEELASLRDQLAKANAELDRIKKRLANPSR